MIMASIDRDIFSKIYGLHLLLINEDVEKWKRDVTVICNDISHPEELNLFTRHAHRGVFNFLIFLLAKDNSENNPLDRCYELFDHLLSCGLRPYTDHWSALEDWYKISKNKQSLCEDYFKKIKDYASLLWDCGASAQLALKTIPTREDIFYNYLNELKAVEQKNIFEQELAPGSSFSIISRRKI